ncbi:MAG: hypothetical protein CL878_11045 [Dehalococcoidia bacterium]|nr:hypothetical protein [Dehalococcoidia bacterium]
MDGLAARARPLLTEAIQRRVFPGAVLAAVGQTGGASVVTAGHLTYARDSLVVDHKTLYDIASVTKIVTLTATLVLASAGHLSLDDRVGDLLDCATFSSITVRQVLAHTAGLRLSLSSLKDVSRPEIEAAILATGPVTEPGTQFYYSSQGYYLLGKVLEVVSGRRLEDCLQEAVLDPLGMNATIFNPPAAWQQRIAPTEDDPWRSGVVWGVPHDEGTFALGGVAGHAGLFSTAEDLLKLGRLWLNEGMVGGRPLIRRDLVRESIEDNYREAAGATGFRVQRFALGWGLEDRDYIGSLASSRAYSLLGFTGPALTIDPDQGAVIVIMNNRVHPTRDGPSRARYHAAITEAAMQWLCRRDHHRPNQGA